MSSIYAKKGLLYANVRRADGRRSGVAMGLRDTPENRQHAKERLARLPPADVLRPARRQARPGDVQVVYFLREHGQGFIKIGHSSRPHARMEDFQAAMPHTLELLATGPGGSSAETALHAVFAEARVRGEWFRPVPELLRLIELLRRPW